MQEEPPGQLRWCHCHGAELGLEESGAAAALDSEAKAPGQEHLQPRRASQSRAAEQMASCTAPPAPETPRAAAVQHRAAPAGATGTTAAPPAPRDGPWARRSPPAPMVVS